MINRQKLRNLTVIASICLAVLAAGAAGLFNGWNRSLGDIRMALSPTPSTGKIVFVAVDARSLAAVGAWPWSRSVHADLLNRLIDLGAGDILLDFDFAFPADIPGDAALEQALDRAGGSVYLAVFEQNADLSDTGSRHRNLPLDRFATRSWPALVNVETDATGLVRDYPVGAELAGSYLPSAAAMLANDFGTEGTSFEINFSIAPGSIPVISAIDLLNGSVPLDAISGKSVVVGASAVELADQLAIPVHGIVPGPLIHILAAETLSRSLSPGWLRTEWVTLMLAVCCLLLQSVARNRAKATLIGGAIGLAAIEACAMVSFHAATLHVPTAQLYPGLAAYCLWSVLRTLNASQLLLVRANGEAQNTLRLLERVLDDSTDSIIVFSEDGTVLRHSASARDLFGVDTHLDIPAPLLRRVMTDASDTPKGTRLIDLTLKGATRTLEYQISYSELDLPSDSRRGSDRTRIATLVARDVTEIQEQERHIAYLSNYDERSGALRRNAFLTLLEMRLAQGTSTAILVVALDRLKTINVTLGRDVGDAVIRAVVQRLEGSDRMLSAPARLSGTQFAVFVESNVTRKDADRLAASILDLLSQAYRLHEAVAHIGLCIGYRYVEAATDLTASLALEHAEEALDTAKLHGKRLTSFDPSAWQMQRQARRIESAMEAALEQGEFQLHYQPQLCLASGRLIGAEALIRWNSPELGTVYPDAFIDIAETTGFIVELGRWSLERAAQDALRLPADLAVAVNVSGIQIMRDGFASEVEAILSKVGLPPERLCLELTETVLLTSVSTILETMQDLNFLGLTWALDDFGTGFSSLAYLSRMPLDKIKLDKSFTLNLEEDPTVRPILQATSDLARTSGSSCSAKGSKQKRSWTSCAPKGAPKGKATSSAGRCRSISF